ncbi:TadE/TadG family type IV pilus assembly protein [Desulfitobacterium chlororespirans]|uniref:Flp pilus-assembly TadE/G-like n=1 Tax=Desulfitobacterium chlororespirans DSM 11544 TaxID=1121395 RepID=A0A1M7UYC4_9FIRM|nr:hypothetical protein [Desulfitobacterium chlororespirans]SHN87916.1 hypothetical protein SAMN02745215_05027 [Desulfitobacterium chlororespirans DSM 11544]
MSKLRTLIRDKRGLSYPLVAAIVLSLMMLMMVGYEYMRIQIIASGVRNAVQAATLTVANDNAEMAYGGIKNGYSGGYARSDTVWLPSLNTGDIYAEIDRILGTKPQGGHHVKIADDWKEFEVYGLMVDVVNAPFTPEHTERDKTLFIMSRITLEVPVLFMGNQVDVMMTDLVVSSDYMAKF